jgi:hypothetical protein
MYNKLELEDVRWLGYYIFKGKSKDYKYILYFRLVDHSPSRWP